MVVIYISSDYGNNWTGATALYTLNWQSISISSSGQYQSAVVNNSGNIYISSDYGNNWRQTGYHKNWTSISISSSGQYISAVVYGGFIYICDNLYYENIDQSYGPFEGLSVQSFKNYGNNWTPGATALNVQNWQSISISSSGQYQSAVVFNDNIYISSDYGNNWTGATALYTLDWTSISVSSSGQYQSAVVYGGNIYISSDYGNIWTFKASVLNWRSISISSSGQYQSAVDGSNGFIYISSDYGNNWTPKDSPRLWSSISVSSSGQYQSAVVFNGSIYISSDYGNNWTNKESQRSWISISVSSSGQYQSAVVYSPINGYIYISKDYGNTWTHKMNDIERSWTSISVSSSGQYQSAVKNLDDGLSGYIYISTNYGNTWNQKENQREWRSISMSSSGQYISAVVYGEYIYTCNNLIDLGLTETNAVGATGLMYYDPINNSIGYNTTGKTFVIDHPLDKNKYLVHGCLEGPEVGVYYRGKGEITNNEYDEIELPDYVDSISTDFTIQTNQIYNGSNIVLSCSEVENNKFKVYGKNTKYYYLVIGKRNSLEVEPLKNSVVLKGDGPYKWI